MNPKESYEDYLRRLARDEKSLTIDLEKPFARSLETAERSAIAYYDEMRRRRR